MKQVFLGLSIAVAVLSGAAFTVQKANIANDLVGYIAPGQWRLLNPSERAMTWDCIEGCGPCTGTLKNTIVADPTAIYSNSQVDFTIGDFAFIAY